jgi:hypothetical protein
MTITLSKEIEKQLADVPATDREAFVNVTLKEALDSLKQSNAEADSIKDLLVARVANLDQAVEITDFDKWETDTLERWSVRGEVKSA